MKKFLLIFLILLQINAFSQQKEIADHFTLQIREEEGDLNKDGLTDKVIISMDTIDATQPLRLQVYFKQPDHKFKLIISTTDLLDPQYPNGKYGGNQIPDIFIEDGYLILNSEIRDEHIEHKFLFNKGIFELIHLSKVIWDGKNTTTETDFNLVTGIKTEVVKSLGSEEILWKSEKKINIKPLPNILNIKNFISKFD
ncbi:MAG: hypothetical protein K0R36_3327 [Chryseobacterium sp.]|jgi:hypothetical protein|nr:hypothetical protein [Chryseobacterium sp.]